MQRRTYTRRSQRRDQMQARAQGYSAAMRSAAIQKARRTGMYTVPRTRGALAQTERKYFDTFLSAKAVVAATDWTATEVDPATLNTLFAPVQGDDINQRVGRKVHVLKITIRGVIRVPAQANQTASDAASCVRLILYLDKQTNGAQAQGENLMSGPGAANALLCPNTFQSTANFGRFRVLKDLYLTMQNPALGYDGTNMEVNGLIKPFKISINFRLPVIIRFNDTNGGTVADIIDNSFHMVATATNVADLAPLLYYQCRVVYMDA